MGRLRDLKRMGGGRAVRRRLGSGWRRRPAVGLAAMGVVIMLSMWTDDIYVDIRGQLRWSILLRLGL